MTVCALRVHVLLRSHAFPSVLSARIYSKHYACILQQVVAPLLLYPKIESETISEGLKSQIFMGGMPPDPLSGCASCALIILCWHVLLNWTTANLLPTVLYVYVMSLQLGLGLGLCSQWYNQLSFVPDPPYMRVRELD